jgi:hypothetical protein
MVKTGCGADRVVFFVSELEDGSFVATCASHGIFTQGERIAELGEMLGDAVACHFGDLTTRPAVFVKRADSDVPMPLEIDR